MTQTDEQWLRERVPGDYSPFECENCGIWSLHVPKNEDCEEYDLLGTGRDCLEAWHNARLNYESSMKERQ